MNSPRLTPMVCNSKQSVGDLSQKFNIFKKNQVPLQADFFCVY
jgi:hypothetical protein